MGLVRLARGPERAVCDSLRIAAGELVRTASSQSGLRNVSLPGQCLAPPLLDLNIPGAVGCLASQDEMGH